MTSPVGPWSGVAAEVRVASRRLIRARWFAGVTIVSIAASTAVLAAMFAVASSTDLRHLSYDPGGRLSVLYTRHDSSSSAPGEDGPGFSYSAFTDYRLRARSFGRLEAVSLVNKRPDVNGVPGDAILGHAATPGFLSMLGVRPAAGRWFTSDDTLAGTPRVVVLSYAYWSASYGAEAGLVGKRIMLRDRFPAGAPPVAYTVIGILPRDFIWDQRNTVWIPMSRDEPQTRASITPIGVLRADIALSVATDEGRAIAGDLADVLDLSRPPGDKMLGGHLTIQATSWRTYVHERVGGASA
ncbi:MAG: ABC transporter permease [Gemmatimonadaceae bacterium]